MYLCVECKRKTDGWQDIFPTIGEIKIG